MQSIIKAPSPGRSKDLYYIQNFIFSPIKDFGFKGEIFYNEPSM